MANKLIKYANGTWITGPGDDDKTKSQTVFKTVQNSQNPVHSNKLSPGLNDRQDMWQALGSPWYSLIVSGALGVSLAINVILYSQFKYTETKVSETNAQIRVLNK